MATQFFSVAPDNSTDAAFRAWGSAISASIAAAGWIKTADTGQINWTTVLHPTVANTIVGYEMWQMNDALGGTDPILMYVGYCSATTSAAHPALRIQVGIASNGSGSLTTEFTQATVIHLSGSASTTAATCFVSGDSGRISMCLWPNYMTSGHSMFFSVERTRDAFGNLSGDGAVLLSLSNGQSPTSQLLWRAGAAPTEEIVWWNVVLPYSTLTFVWNGQVGVSPVFVMAGGITPPGISQLAHLPGDFTSGQIFAAVLYGVSHTYRSFADAYNTFSSAVSRTAGAPQLAMLWE